MLALKTRTLMWQHQMAAHCWWRVGWAKVNSVDIRPRTKLTMVLAAAALVNSLHAYIKPAVRGKSTAAHEQLGELPLKSTPLSRRAASDKVLTISTLIAVSRAAVNKRRRWQPHLLINLISISFHPFRCDKHPRSPDGLVCLHSVSPSCHHNAH